VKIRDLQATCVRLKGFLFELIEIVALEKVFEFIGRVGFGEIETSCSRYENGDANENP